MAQQQTTGGTRALLEVILAVVLVVALASFLLTALGWLVGAVWWLFKVTVLVVAIFIVARVLLARRRTTS